MRYSLLDHLGCPYCKAALASITVQEELVTGTFPILTRPSASVPREGAQVGPLPESFSDGPINRLLSRYAGSAAPPERNRMVVLNEGALVCWRCGRWFPVLDALPELLPDHLRDPERDDRIIAKWSGKLPDDLLDLLRGKTPRVPAETEAPDASVYKRAEMSLPSKITDPGFFGPGYTSPFNVWNPEFSFHLLQSFAASAPLLSLKRGDAVLDSGCGYAWTTDWLYRCGFEPIGIDLTRRYLEIALVRCGGERPHLVIGDVEALPLRDHSVKGVFAFESFHHLPNRNRAMREYTRTLQLDGRIVLAEPGPEHEFADGSVDVMKKFGILERGMDFADVLQYVRGTDLRYVTEVSAARFTRYDNPPLILRSRIRGAPLVPGRIFVIERTPSARRQLRRRRPLRWPVWFRYKCVRLFSLPLQVYRTLKRFLDSA